MIRRVIRKRSANPSDSVGFRSDWVRPSTQTMSQESTDTLAADPPRIVYDCPSHAGPDLSRVSSNIQLFLSRRGLSEFAPVFSYLGVRTDTDFIRFCAFSGKEKEELVENARHQLGRKLILNAFQRVALKLEFAAKN